VEICNLVEPLVKDNLSEPVLKQTGNTHPLGGMFPDESREAMPVHCGRGDGRKG